MDKLQFLDEPDPNRRNLLFLLWLSKQAEQNSVPPPTLVGGAAVAFYTNGCYTSSDIDLVAPGTQVLFNILQNNGFERDGRYWFNGPVVVEFPSDQLAGEYDTFEIDGSIVRIISIEDLIADRLAVAKFWCSEKDRQWAKVLLNSSEHDANRLLKKALENDTADLLTTLLYEDERNVDNDGYTCER